MKKWMRYRVLALVLVAVMLVSYLPGVNLGFAQGTKAAETWELPSGTVVTAQMVKDQFGLGSADTWKILDSSNEQVMSCTVGVGGDWTTPTAGTYTIQRYEQTGTTGGWLPLPTYDYVDFAKFELVLTTSLKETTMEAANTVVDFTGTALDEQAIIAALGITVKAGDEIVANPVLSLEGNWAGRKIQKQDESGDYQHQISNEITEYGNYRVTVVFGQTDAYQGCKMTVDFSVVDGRADTQVVVNSNVELGYVGEALTAENIIKAVFDCVMADGKEVAGATVTLKNDLFGNTINKWSDTLNAYVTYGKEITEYGKYQVTLAYAGDESYKASETTVEFTVVDGRVSTIIEVENPTVEVTYGAYTAEELMALLGGVTVKDEDGAVVADAEVVFEDDVTSLNAGSHTVTLTYAGTNYYQSASVEVTVTVNKADATVTVDSVSTTYGESVNASELITVSPQGLDTIEFAVGFGLGADVTTDGAVVAYVNLPELVDVDALPPLVKPVVEEILKQIGNGTTMNIDQLNELLTGLLEDLKGVQNVVDLGIDTTAVETLIGILSTIQDLNVVNDLTIKLTMGQDIILEDAGAYLVGGVVSDPNYNTAYNVGGVAILPDAQRVELAFDMDFPYGLVTPTVMKQDDFSFGAHVVGYDLDDALQAKVNNLYFGVDANGNFYADQTPSTAFGAYTQIAYIAQLGNEFVYAVPAVRAYAVVLETVDVDFAQDSYTFTFDNTAKGVTATVTDKQGNKLDEQYLSYYYMGVESDGELYYSSQAPSQTGLYTVVAAYVSDDLKYVGMDVATLVINPAEATISVGDAVHTYDGTAVDVSALVESSPEDAKTAVIMAGLDVSGDFSENGWSAVYGVVNVDLPARADELLRDVVPAAYGDGINLTAVVNQINELVSSMEQAGLDVTYLNCAVELLGQLPDQVTVTFKEQSEVNPSNIGAYLVVGAIFDPNYQLSMDAGVVVITPEVTEATLEWNYTDDNGIITTPVLDKIDFNASAYVDGVKDEVVTNGIAYVFVGFNDQGKLVFTDNAADLTLGAYTQMAYYLEEVSADITVAAPIIRSFLVAPQTADVQLEDTVVTYDGQPQNMAVTVVDMDGNVIDKPENLTVTYVGVNVEGGYHSTQAPTETGVYTVIATYVEKDANGELQRVGANVATLTIQPAQADFQLMDTTLPHDGTEKFVTVNNPNNLEYISVIVDENQNVNIVLPDSWNVEPTTVDVAGGIDAVLTILEKLPACVQQQELVQQLRQVLESVNVTSIQINGALPTEVGTYQVTAIAYGANYQMATSSAVLTLIHSFSDAWSYDADNHWHECHCGEKHDVAAHTFVWVIDQEATETAAGSKHEECTVCGYAKAAVEIPATGVEVEPSVPPTEEPTVPPTEEPTVPPTGEPTVPPTADPSPEPSQGTDSSDTDTGDTAHLTFWIVLLVVSVCVLIGVNVYDKKRRASR